MLYRPTEENEEKQEESETKLLHLHLSGERLLIRS